MKSKKFTIALSLVVILILGTVAGYIAYRKGFIQRIINKAEDITQVNAEIQEEVITTADGHKVLMDHPKGYMLSFPDHMNFDLSISPELIKVYDDHMTAFVTREWSPYVDRWEFIDDYFNNYYLNDYYIRENNITIRKNEKFQFNGADAMIVSLRRNTENTDCYNEYTYFYVFSKTADRAFFRVMFKYDDYETCIPVINEIINSFEEITLKGQNVFKNEYKPVPNSNWNEETRKFYEDITNHNSIKWGLFVDGSYTIDRNYQWFVDLEKKVDYNFDFALHYINLDWEFPVKEMQKFYDDGKITELTLQISNFNNDDLFGKNINFDVYDGLMDEEIRNFARGAKEFGHPFLFRLNNEMNSDWVNYSGVAALSDPEIFIEIWRKIYNIFDEEGVDNAIWIYNPNAEDCPPAHWNSYIAYFPGGEYVHMIGMTGYNTGTYYADVYNEKWRTFDEIYKEPYEKYMNVFSEFPFIITEFASSSVGGDKVQWINDMFESIKEYKNIKMALWWSSADYDMRKETYKHVARPYFLDETEETTAAFREGVKKYKKKKWFK